MTLAELITRDGVQAHWFWTHEVSTGPYTEHEVWDVVFVRNTYEPKRWVTDGDTRRTAYFTGLHGTTADSRRATGGNRREPVPALVLADLLTDASQYDNNPTLSGWITEAHEAGGFDPSVLDHYYEAQRISATLHAWLGDQYDEYLAAAQG